MQKNKINNINTFIDKIKLYCIKTDRCQLETEIKLKDWGLKDSDIIHIVKILESEKILNHERYAKAFCRGKFKIKKWGKIRISRHLKMKKISEESIQKGMQQINDIEYHETILYLINKKARLIKNNNEFIKKNKISRYLQQKGFEKDLVWNIIIDI